MAAPKTTDDPNRKAELAKIHAAKRTLKLTDESYRDRLRRITGKESAGAMDAADRAKVIADFTRLGAFDGKQGGRSVRGRRRADHRQARLARALWLSAWHLGVIDDASEGALAAFAKRQTGVDDLHWLTDPKQIAAVIEALKSMLARAGVVWPTTDTIARIKGLRDMRGITEPVPRGLPDRLAVMEAQWRKLIGLRAVQKHAWLKVWVGNRYGRGEPAFLTPQEADRAIRALGGWLRKAKGEGERR